MTSARCRGRAASIAAACAVAMPLAVLGATASSAAIAAPAPVWRQQPTATPVGLTNTGLVRVSVYGLANDNSTTFGAVWRSVDGGAWQYVGSATTTVALYFNLLSVNDAVAPGHTYRYAVYATESDGSSGWGYSDLMRFGVVDDSSPNLVWHGSWKKVRQNKAFGKTVHVTSDRAAAVSFTKQFHEMGLVLTVPHGTTWATLSTTSGDSTYGALSNSSRGAKYLQFFGVVSGASGRLTTVTLTPKNGSTLDFDAFLISNDLTTG